MNTQTRVDLKNVDTTSDRKGTAETHLDAPVELDLTTMKLVAGGLPRGGWSAAATTELPRGGW